MTKSQWAAVYHFCDEFGCSPRELLDELKESGVVDRSAKLADLGEYPAEPSYDAMMMFLAKNT